MNTHPECHVENNESPFRQPQSKAAALKQALSCHHSITAASIENQAPQSLSLTGYQ